MFYNVSNIQVIWPPIIRVDNLQVDYIHRCVIYRLLIQNLLEAELNIPVSE